ncbi:unnamed protein product, partial [Prorocentrum cordatum]
MLEAFDHFQLHFRLDAAAIFEERLFSEGLWQRACAGLVPTSPSYLQRAVDIKWGLGLTAGRCDVILPSSLVGEITQQLVADAVRPGCTSTPPSPTLTATLSARFSAALPVRAGGSSTRPTASSTTPSARSRAALPARAGCSLRSNSFQLRQLQHRAERRGPKRGR